MQLFNSWIFLAFELVVQSCALNGFLSVHKPSLPDIVCQTLIKTYKTYNTRNFLLDKSLEELFSIL
jgi:hypothetical protein